MTRRTIVLFACVFVLAALAAGCGDEPQEQPAPADEPPTWRQWVAETRPQREASDAVFYRRDGLPDMRRWRPADFLPAEALEAEHVDMCSLPLDERRELDTAIPNASGEPEHLPLLRRYAERGVVQAQAALGGYCTISPEYDVAGISQAEALLWAQKAAASGDAYAMDTLARCLEYRERYEQLADHDFISKADFVWDEHLYWRWRSARAMRYDAMLGMEDALHREVYAYPSREQRAIHEYKWGRLAQVFATLGHPPPEFLKLVGPSLAVRDYAMTEAQIEQAEALVGDWLRKRLEDFDQYRIIGGCPDHAWNGGKPFDYAAFNAELAKYGLSVDPDHAERWAPPRYGQRDATEAMD